MALTVTPGYSFSDGDLVTAVRLNSAAGGTVADGQAGSFSTGSFSATVSLSGAASILNLGGATLGQVIAFSSDLYLSAGGTHSVFIQCNSATVGTFTSAGINGTAIGATTPSTGVFTTLQGGTINGTTATIVTVNANVISAATANLTSIGSSSALISSGLSVGGSVTFSALNAAGIVTNNSSGVLSTSASLPAISFITAGTVRATSDFTVNASTTLTAVTGLSVNITSGNTYLIEGVMIGHGDASGGGYKVGTYGSAGLAASNFMENWSFSTSGSSLFNSGVNIALKSIGTGGYTLSQAGSNFAVFYLSGTITVSTSGTLGIQFAQQSAAGSSILYAGSWLRVQLVS